MKNEASIKIVEKPDYVSWDEIHNVLWKAHEQNRQKGVNMAFPALPGEEIRKKITEGHGKMLVAMDGQKIVGTAAIIVKASHLWCGKGDYAYLCFASVLPEYNGKGIFKALDIKREELALSMHLTRITGETHENNRHRLDIAQKAGYKIVDYKVTSTDHYNVIIVKWLNGCPYSDWYIKWQFQIRKWYTILRYKPGHVKRFGI